MKRPGLWSFPCYPLSDSEMDIRLDRRRFLAAGAVLPVGVSKATNLLSDDPPRIRFAVKYNMVTEKLSVTEKFALLRDVGFDGVEVNVRDRRMASQFGEASKSSGVSVHGVVNSFAPAIATAVEFAHELKADSVLVVAKEDPNRLYAQNFADWQKLVDAALSVAAERRVRILIENVRATFLKTAEEMARFIDSFQTDLVGAYFDTGNAISWTNQSAEHWAKVLGTRIRKIDVKDRGHHEFGDVKLKRAGIVGTDGGEVHWKNVRRELTNIHYRGWATAEVKGGHRNHLRLIQQWMQGLLERV